MKARRINGFFYGLFMDRGVLHENNVTPECPRRAYVDDFALRIGRRATLIPSTGARSYGMLYALTHEEIGRLYSGPGLEGYVPEAVAAQIIDGEVIPAICYNLSEGPDARETNSEYAARLRSALTKLDFPPEYGDSIS
ncbi:MAG: hypothetical protein ACJAU6_001853 [Alphaproteobacteria bacterium]|jgi:hypothetical protein